MTGEPVGREGGLPFYLSSGVVEALLVWPTTRQVHCYDLTGDEPVRATRSRELDVEMVEIEAAVEWPV